jgi:hypothetical protein
VSPKASARGALCRLLMGTPNTDKTIIGAAEHVLGTLPVWGDGGRSVDFDYWLWGTTAAFQCGGETWKKWNAATRDMLCDNQRRGGPMDGSVNDVDGSWDRHGPGSGRLGRLGVTAQGVLTLETYYRYLPMYTK